MILEIRLRGVPANFPWQMLPTETKVESWTSQGKRETSDNLGESGISIASRKPEVARAASKGS